jgi:hypothetical protein
MDNYSVPPGAAGMIMGVAEITGCLGAIYLMEKGRKL